MPGRESLSCAAPLRSERCDSTDRRALSKTLTFPGRAWQNRIAGERAIRFAGEDVCAAYAAIRRRRITGQTAAASATPHAGSGTSGVMATLLSVPSTV